jgi:tRNA pseudouridine38-40 synthase
MVRNMMGTLVDIGLGKRPVTGLVDALEAKDRTQAGMTFEADGLYLVRVDY